mmetsp:Transcript_33735/g.79657  ORF Transcript_33735/g.79657 Transcript_33735/m.79657 type:complete len:214 (-) Transcript_33735:243-884(-)
MRGRILIITMAVRQEPPQEDPLQGGQLRAPRRAGSPGTQRQGRQGRSAGQAWTRGAAGRPRPSGRAGAAGTLRPRWLPGAPRSPGAAWAAGRRGEAGHHGTRGTDRGRVAPGAVRQSRRMAHHGRRPLPRDLHQARGVRDRGGQVRAVGRKALLAALALGPQVRHPAHAHAELLGRLAPLQEGRQQLVQRGRVEPHVPGAPLGEGHAQQRCRR